MAIIKLLISNGRASYSSIARSVGLSTSSVIARVNNMLKVSIIDRFLVRVNLVSLGYRVIHIIVKHNGNEHELTKRLCSIGHVFMIVTCLGDFSIFALAVNEEAYNNSSNNNRSYIAVLEQCIKPNRILYMTSVKAETKRLTYNDLRIIRYLIKDARARVKDIARELRISVKTVERRLSRMIKDDIIRFTILINPTMMSFINFIMVIRVSNSNNNNNTSNIVQWLENLLSNNLLMPLIHAAYDTLVAVLHAYNTDEINMLLKKVKGIKGVNEVEFFIVQKIVSDDYSKVIDEIMCNSESK